MKHELNKEDFLLDEIVSIELVGERDTIDISVEDTHMFFANDIYTHNSAAQEEVIQGDKIAGSYEKLMHADFVMSWSRKVEDKLAGTARGHVIKNRFGPDGLTLPSKFNGSNGRIELFEPNTIEGRDTQKSMDNSTEFVRKHLKARHQELFKEEEPGGE